MTLHLLYGRWWPIVCPPSSAFLNYQKRFINGALHTLLLALTYPKWRIRLYVVQLVTQGPSGLPATIPSADVLT